MGGGMVANESHPSNAELQLLAVDAGKAAVPNRCFCAALVPNLPTP